MKKVLKKSMNKKIVLFIFCIITIHINAQNNFVKLDLVHKTLIGYGATVYYKLDEFEKVKKNIDKVTDSLENILKIWGLPLSDFSENECKNIDPIYNLSDLFQDSCIYTIISSRNFDISLSMIKMEASICEFQVKKGSRYLGKYDIFDKIGNVVSFLKMDIGKKESKKFYQIVNLLEKKLNAQYWNKRFP